MYGEDKLRLCLKDSLATSSEYLGRRRHPQGRQSHTERSYFTRASKHTSYFVGTFVVLLKLIDSYTSMRVKRPSSPRQAYSRLGSTTILNASSSFTESCHHSSLGGTNIMICQSVSKITILFLRRQHRYIKSSPVRRSVLRLQSLHP